MKKFSAILLVIVIAIACLTACTNNSSTNTPSSQPTQVEEATESSIDFDELSLVKAYCNDTWDGSFISNDDHCASIIDGELWFDCQTSEQVPDMGAHENCFWVNVLSYDDAGTWVQDRQLGTVEMWHKGIRYNKIVLQGSLKGYNTSVYVLSNCIVARNNTDLDVYNFNGGIITSVRDVIDFYFTEKELLYSNFEHKNFKFTGEGEIIELNSNYVRFPRRNVQLEEASNLTSSYFNLYWGTTWDGSFKRIENGAFAYVDSSGNIYVNNKLHSNTNLPINNTISSFGANLMNDIDELLYLNGKELIIYQKAKEKVVDIPDGSAKFIWSNAYGTVILVYGSSADDNTLLLVRDEDVKIISETVSDANVAYDTLYYMEGNTVYRMSWEEANAEPELFIEGAYAVSTHTDELEGAIVPAELNNMEGYKQYNLYSPFGSDKK